VACGRGAIADHGRHPAQYAERGAPGKESEQQQHQRTAQFIPHEELQRDLLRVLQCKTKKHQEKNGSENTEDDFHERLSFRSKSNGVQSAGGDNAEIVREKKRHPKMPFIISLQTTQSSMIGCPTIASTRSRNCLPGLKCGTRFSGTITLSPDFGLRPMRGGRLLSAKLPKPRISMRWPVARAFVIASRMVLIVYSASLATS